jgi:hypothetical protein
MNSNNQRSVSRSIGRNRFFGRSIPIAMGLIALVATWTGPALAGEWQGKEVAQEGVKHMMNPADPMEAAATADLEELWRVGGETDDEDEFFGVIVQITADKTGNVYLLDMQLAEVKIFDKDGNFVRSIGREGEGPGEFRFPVSMFFTGDGNIAVMQVQPGKIVQLTAQGEPAGEHPIPKGQDGAFLTLVGGQAAANNVVLAAAEASFLEGKWQQKRYLASINRDGAETARYCQDTRTIEMANAVLDDMEWDTFDRRWLVGRDGRVYAVTTYPDYRVHVWNPDGSVNRIIEREYTHRKRTEEEKRIVTEMMGLFTAQIPNCELRITDYTKDIENIFVRDDGSLWVLTSDGSRDQPEGALGVFDVFDPDGRLVRQVTLMGQGDPLTDGYYFVGDRLYVVTDLLQAIISLQSGGQSVDLGEEEPAPMSVICYQIDGDFLTFAR